MFHLGPSEVLILLTIVALIVGSRRLRRFGMSDDLDRLGAELHRKPVYSAETTQGKEAEFIRDQLPKRFPWLLFLAGVLAFGALAWWLSHR